MYQPQVLKALLDGAKKKKADGHGKVDGLPEMWVLLQPSLDQGRVIALFKASYNLKFDRQVLATVGSYMMMLAQTIL